MSQQEVMSDAGKDYLLTMVRLLRNYQAVYVTVDDLTDRLLQQLPP